MVYNGKVLLLDNFRKELSGYSIDIQDVVRSAILDGVDISCYIDICKANPQRLDQIRLGMKEGLSTVFFRIRSGECIYAIRKSTHAVQDVLEAKMSENISDDLVYLLLDWINAGYNLSGINVSVIPRNLYPVFKKGFQLGLDMRVFNDGKNYSEEYLYLCMRILTNGKNVDVFCNEVWSIECLKCLASFSKIKEVEKWDMLLRYISNDMDIGKIKLLISCVKNGIDISEISRSCWSADEIKYVLLAYDQGLDYVALIKSKTEGGKSVQSVYDILNLNKSKRVSGRFRKN